MPRKNMIFVRGKYRYGKPSEKDAIKWDDSAKRLNLMLRLSQMSAKKICDLSEESEKVIYQSNFSDYRNALRGMTPEHLEFIAQTLFASLKKKGYDYNYDLFKLFLSGHDHTCDTYEEFVAMASEDHNVVFGKYRDLFKHAGFLLSYDDGFFSITDDKDNPVDCGYDDPKYGVCYNGTIKHFSPKEMEEFYLQIVKYMQDAFMNKKEGDAID